MNIIILGMQGAGKGTQAKLLKEQYNIAHICTGDIFREAYAKRTELGIQAHDEYWGKGNLVPDDVTNKLVQERLKEEDCQQGFVLDGYPRTIGQARFLDSITTIDFVINLEIPENIALQRLAGREQCKNCGELHGIDASPKSKGVCNKCGGQLYKRTDDSNSEAVTTRIHEYQNKTRPLLDYYKKQEKLYVVNGGQKTSKVNEKVHSVLG